MKVWHLFGRRWLKGKTNDQELLHGQISEQHDGNLRGQHSQEADDTTLQAVHPLLSILVVLATYIKDSNEKQIDPHQTVCTSGTHSTKSRRTVLIPLTKRFPKQVIKAMTHTDTRRTTLASRYVGEVIHVVKHACLDIWDLHSLQATPSVHRLQALNLSDY